MNAEQRAAERTRWIGARVEFEHRLSLIVGTVVEVRFPANSDALARPITYVDIRSDRAVAFMVPTDLVRIADERTPLAN